VTSDRKNHAEQQFAAAAGSFCELVEQHARHADSAGWLKLVGQLLLRLDEQIRPLNGHTVEAEFSMLQDLEERFQLFRRLKAFLGALDEYWSEGDLEAGDGLKTGSLADDITDVYFDLKRGLLLYGSGGNSEQRAIDLWLYSYHAHWEQHLRDARKQLFDFRRIQ
jgi:Domain of unknown function (DUF5063)